MWEIEKIVRKGKYNYAIVRGHPNALAHDYVLHHRVVMENSLGRLLDASEHVHHKNGITLDNSLENLQVLTEGEHKRMHGLERGRMFADLVCPMCKKPFTKEFNKTHAGKSKGNATFCSKVCSSRFYSTKPKNAEETCKMESAISGNIIRVYKKYSYDNPEGTQDSGTP